ncbi:TBC1 domain family member 13, partial [Leucoagaricus sp. SymC.cos]
AQLKSTIQLLGQLQAKKDADATITRKDIATLLQQGNVVLARSKAQKLIQEDTFADLMEELEQQVGTVMERFAELEHRSSPSPTLLEASSSIIFAAPRAQIPELNVISDMISDRLGEDVARSARANRHNQVSPGVLRTTSRPIPNLSQLDSYLERVAKSYEVSWIAGPKRQNLVDPLSEVLNPPATPSIDITRLRHLCSQGIPDEPSWLRPRIWKLFMNVLPVDKSLWKKENVKQRDAYYDLVRRLLKPFTELPPPINPISGQDKTLLEVYNHLARIPVDLLSQLDSEPEDLNSCPLHPSSSEDIRIPFANCLDTRLRFLRRLNEVDLKNHSVDSTPEIRLETDPDAMPAISLTEADTSPDHHNAPTTLLSSKSITLGSASQRHISTLLRLLYIHASINPGNLSPYLPSLLVPLYTTLMQEVEHEDLAHAEADTFWLFEAFVAEFAELEDDDGSSLWMTRLGEQLRCKDAELLELLILVGLHPSSPHFSRRWLSSMLTHTLPLLSIYPAWDVVLSRPSRERGKNPRLDSLIEICSAMVIAAKPLILKQGKAPGLWDKDPLGSSDQFGEAFLEGLTVLQSYPIESLGGIDTILQLMADLSRRNPTTSLGGTGRKDQQGLGARIRVTMWKGFTNQVASPEGSDEEGSDEEGSSESEEEEGEAEEIDDGNETETPSTLPQANNLTSRIANSVWRGITNQSSMEAPPSPIFLPSPDASRPTTPPASSKVSTLIPDPPKGNVNSASAGLWSYTEKLKDSDTMATIAKLSSNWRAKAMLSPWGRPKEPVSAPVAPPQETRSAMTSPVVKSVDSAELKRSSLPIYDHSGAVYTPPPRPSFFRNPRDSFIPSEAAATTLSPTELSHRDDSPPSEKSSRGLLEKTRHLQSSLLSLTRTPSPRPPQLATPRSGPRPLLLNSSTLITSHNSGRSRVAPSHDSIGEDWTEVMKLRNTQLHRDSMSSVSSLSPSDAINRKLNRSEYDSDASTSRVVPLNRRSVSPMALASKTYHSRPPSTTSTVSSDQANPETPAKENPVGSQDAIGVASPKEDEITPNGKSDIPILPEQASLTRRSYRRKPQPSPSGPDDTSDSSIGDINSRAARLRSKRYPLRLSNLQIDNTAQFEEAKSTSPSSNLTVAWPSEDLDAATTPKASSFESNAIRSPSKSPKIKEERPKKLSNNARHRKLSNTNREAVRRSRTDSAAEDGDDEGYDDLLSAYESEESASLA